MLQVIAGYDPLDPSTVPAPVPDHAAALGHDVRGLRTGIPTKAFRQADA
jgi:aspartyl-tRNA(Asn)/glutamyl-tRNA(Gln) amidotransferase subunit A